ncbi:MAG TPA: hypothetical protein VHV51_09690 [Polyangiaceae bacterium]|jgi:hypothetical protein|nr:hypothetical protein [Polyangiaceae bacterium]
MAVAPPADPRLAERLHQAEEQRQKERMAAVKDAKAWNEGRNARAIARRDEIAKTWGNAVSSTEAQAELRTHADRMARLDRILDIANQKADNALAARCRADIQFEIDRDLHAMEELRAKEGMR